MNPHLNAARLAQLETALMQRRQALEQAMHDQLGELGRIEHAREQLLQEADGESAHDADREVDLARSDSDLDALRHVNEALQRLSRGEYGLCQDCAQAIPFERLQLSPEVTRCIACQQALEKKSGSHHSSL
ncbi:TraR/DksA family transcriptional regulator [Roseateles sp. GG27B]